MRETYLSVRLSGTGREGRREESGNGERNKLERDLHVFI